MSDAKNAMPGKRAWKKPVLKPVGKIADALKGGGGKLSPTANDTGDDRKPKGAGA